MTTYDIDGVEIFAAGTWNGDTYTLEDLQNLVKAFGATRDALKPYLKIGHSETQKLLERDALPAAGWIENLRLDGDRLVADFKRVPKKIYDLITAGAYRRVSSEIYVNFEHGGVVWPFALKAVSILGGETPAVATLDDIVALYGLDLSAKPAVFESQATVKAYEFSRAPKEEVNVNELEKAKADLADATKKLSESEAKVAALEAEKAELAGKLTESEKKFAEAQDKLAAVEKEKKHAQITGTVDRLISEKKILPAQKDLAYALLDSAAATGERKFKLGDKEYTPEGLVLAFVDAGKAALPTEPQTSTGEASESDDVEAAKKYASEKGVSLKDAMLTLARQKQKATAKAEDGE